MLDRTVVPKLFSSDRDRRSKGGDVEQDGQHGALDSVAGAAASSEESCSRAESSSLCIAVSAVRAESSSRWADSRTLRCAALYSATGVPEVCMPASECRAAVSRARMSASMDGRGSSMRKQPLLLESWAAGAVIGLDSGARFCIGRMQAERSSGFVEGEGDFTSALRKESADGGIRYGRLFWIGIGGFSGSQRSSRFGVAAIRFGRDLVTFGSPLGAIFVPAGPFAPSAGGPL
eukprot:1018238-Pleurochrysis_carterae.AAC.2